MELTWEFPHWEVQKDLNGHKDVIVTVAWRLTASDGVDEVVVAGTVKLDPPEVGDTDFITREQMLADPQMCHDKLVEWCKSSPRMGYEEYLTNLAANLAAKKPAPLTLTYFERPFAADELEARE